MNRNGVYDERAGVMKTAVYRTRTIPRSADSQITLCPATLRPRTASGGRDGTDFCRADFVSMHERATTRFEKHQVGFLPQRKSAAQWAAESLEAADIDAKIWNAKIFVMFAKGIVDVTQAR